MPIETGRARVRGSAELTAWLTQNKRTQAWLARVLDVTPAAVSQWCSGSKRPDVVQRETLEAITNIQTAAWLNEKEDQSMRAAIATATNTDTDGGNSMDRSEVTS